MISVRGTHVSLYRLGRLFWLAKVWQRRTSAMKCEVVFAKLRQRLKITQGVAFHKPNACITRTSVVIEPVAAQREPMKWAISGKREDFICFHYPAHNRNLRSFECKEDRLKVTIASTPNLNTC